MPRVSGRKSSAAHLNESTSSQTSEDVDEKVLHVAKYMLSMTNRKDLIKRLELVKECFGGVQVQFDTILSRVKSLLLDIYKIEVHEVRDERTVKGYVCVSCLPPVPSGLTKTQRSEALLLSVVLSHIYMKGGIVMENGLFTLIRKIGGGRFFLNDAEKIITEQFVKQGYLQKEKVELESGNFEERIQYQWGHRANFEFPKEGILNTVAKIMDKDASYFSRQYKEIQNEGDETEHMDIS